MNYILFVFWLTGGTNYPHLGVTAEYRSLAACQSASKAIYKEAEKFAKPAFMLCTAKG